MPRQRFKNNAKSTLSVAISSTTQAVLTLQTGHVAARFPYLAVPDYYYITVDDGTNVEVCKVVDTSGDTLIVLRGQEGTTAQAAFAIGSKVELRWTTEGIRHVAISASPFMMTMRPVMSLGSMQMGGLPVPTIVGSSAGFPLVGSSWKTTQPIVRFSQIGSAQNPSSMRLALNIANVGAGFRTRFRFAPHLAPNSSHFFIGMVGTTGAVNSVHPPSSLQNAIVVGYGTGAVGSPLSIWRANATSKAVGLSLGSYFNVSSFAAYEVEFSCVGSEARIDYIVRRLDISSIPDASSFFTTFIPTNSVWLTFYAQMTSMVTSAPNWDFMGFAIDT